MSCSIVTGLNGGSASSQYQDTVKVKLESRYFEVNRKCKETITDCSTNLVPPVCKSGVVGPKVVVNLLDVITVMSDTDSGRALSISGGRGGPRL